MTAPIDDPNSPWFGLALFVIVLGFTFIVIVVR